MRCKKTPQANAGIAMRWFRAVPLSIMRLFRCRSKKTSKLRVTGLCEGNSPVTGEFPAQRASDTENVSIWWRHHASLSVISLMVNREQTII